MKVGVLIWANYGICLPCQRQGPGPQLADQKRPVALTAHAGFALSFAVHEGEVLPSILLSHGSTNAVRDSTAAMLRVRHSGDCMSHDYLPPEEREP